MSAGATPWTRAAARRAARRWAAGWRAAGPWRAGPWRAGAPLLLLLALSGCALLGRRVPDERELTIDLPVPRAEAVRRTLAAFRAQGYAVRETLTSASRPETEPFRHRDDAEAVFRAAVSGSDRASRVVLSGTYRRRELGGLVRGPEREVRRSDDEVERELWARLDNLRLVIRGAPR